MNSKKKKRDPDHGIDLTPTWPLYVLSTALTVLILWVNWPTDAADRDDRRNWIGSPRMIHHVFLGRIGR